MKTEHVVIAGLVVALVALLAALLYVDVQYNALSVKYSTLSDSYDTLSTNYYDLQSQYNALEQNYASLEQNYSALSDQYSACEYNYESLSSEYQSLQNDYQSEVHYVYQWITDGISYTVGSFGTIVGFSKEYDPPYYYIDPLLIQWRKRIRYIPDPVDTDYMESPHAFWSKKGGDCEDYSMAFADLFAVAIHRGYGIIYAVSCQGCKYDLSDGWYYPDLRKAYLAPDEVKGVGMVCGTLKEDVGHCIDYFVLRDGSVLYIDPQNMERYDVSRFQNFDFNYYVPVDSLRPRLSEDDVVLFGD